MRHLSAVPPTVDADTVNELTRLRERAIAGEITGIAYTASTLGGGYLGGIVGRMRLFPIYTLGLLQVLEKKVSELVH